MCPLGSVATMTGQRQEVSTGRTLESGDHQNISLIGTDRSLRKSKRLFTKQRMSR